MITASEPYPQTGSRRLLWSLVFSVILNTVVWLAATWQAHAPTFAASRARPPETLVVSTSTIHLERPHTGPRHSQPAVTPNPLGPSLSLSAGWSKQDEGREGIRGAQAATLWLDWSKQTPEFVPRVFLWQRQAMDSDGDPRKPSLQGAVQDVLDTLHDEGDKLYASAPQRLCGGTRPGWFLSYDKPEDDPPLHVEDTLYVLGDTVYRATYIRPADQPEDRKARDALDSLCA
jgi:hypothetical protein